MNGASVKKAILRFFRRMCNGPLTAEMSNNFYNIPTFFRYFVLKTGILFSFLQPTAFTMVKRKHTLEDHLVG